MSIYESNSWLYVLRLDEVYISAAGMTGTSGYSGCCRSVRFCVAHGTYCLYTHINLKSQFIPIFTGFSFRNTMAGVVYIRRAHIQRQTVAQMENFVFFHERKLCFFFVHSFRKMYMFLLVCVCVNKCTNQPKIISNLTYIFVIN
jgi:hypothetical protein